MAGPNLKYFLALMNMDVNETYDPATDSLEAIGSAVAALMSEVIATGTLTTSSMTAPIDTGRTEGVDYFKGCVFMATAGAAILQPRPIRSNTALGVMTLDEPLTILPGLVTYVILRGSYPVQRLLDIFNIVNGIEVLTETGFVLTTDATEQNIYINNAPAGVFSPKEVKVNFANQGAGETVILRTYYRLVAGGALTLEEETLFAGIIAEPIKTVELGPNRYGIQVTLEKTDGGAAVDYEIGVIYGV